MVFLAFVLVPSPYCGHCCQRFPVLSHFVFVNRFLFYKRTVVRGGEVGLMAGKTIFVYQMGGAIEPIVNWR